MDERVKKADALAAWEPNNAYADGYKDGREAGAEDFLRALKADMDQWAAWAAVTGVVLKPSWHIKRTDGGFLKFIHYYDPAPETPKRWVDVFRRRRSRHG